DDRLALFNRHKQERGLTTDEDAEMTAIGYVSWLVQSCLHTVEMRYYFDDDRADLSPGVYSVLQEIELCRASGREHLYLGLFVQDCRHLSYKADYAPHER